MACADVSGRAVHIQCASPNFPIKKARCLWTLAGSLKIDVDDADNYSCIVYEADCARWNPGASDLKHSEVLIEGLDSIRKEGVISIRNIL